MKKSFSFDGALVQKLRLGRKPKLSRERLAENLGVSSTTIYRWENNKDRPGVDSVSKIAEYFSVPPGTFFGESYNENPTILELSQVISDQSKELTKLRLELNESITETNKLNLRVSISEEDNLTEEQTNIIEALKSAPKGQIRAVKAALGLINRPEKNKKSNAI